MTQQDEIHQKVMGKSIPSTPSLLARGLIAINSQTQGL